MEKASCSLPENELCVSHRFLKVLELVFHPKRVTEDFSEKENKKLL